MVVLSRGAKAPQGVTWRTPQAKATQEHLPARTHLDPQVSLECIKTTVSDALEWDDFLDTLPSPTLDLCLLQRWFLLWHNNAESGENKTAKSR